MADIIQALQKRKRFLEERLSTHIAENDDESVFLITNEIDLIKNLPPRFQSLDEQYRLAHEAYASNPTKAHYEHLQNVILSQIEALTDLPSPFLHPSIQKIAEQQIEMMINRYDSLDSAYLPSSSETSYFPALQPELNPNRNQWDYSEADQKEPENDDDVSNEEVDSLEYDLSDDLDHQADLDHQFALGLAYEEYYNEILNQNLSPALAEISPEKELENIDKFAHEQTLARFQAPSLQQFGIFNQQQNKIAPVPTAAPQLTQQMAPQSTFAPVGPAKQHLHQTQAKFDPLQEALLYYNENAALQTMSDDDFEKLLNGINRDLSTASHTLFQAPKPGMSKSCRKEAEQENLPYSLLPLIPL
ncbi:MAG: hypothetical protein K0R12_829 [Gammaproteobacteria bacterium]|jgi:hypothetical protein|nr:hypothetical protein [Gammaproteobacteria bacterium]